MPFYDFFCEPCNTTVEILKGMNELAPKHCPSCGSKRWYRIFGTAVALHGPCDSGWETENDGLGRWMPQLGPRYLDAHTRTTKNPAAYCRSRADAIDAFKRKGYDDVQKY